MNIVNSCSANNITILYKKNSISHSNITNNNNEILSDGILISKGSSLNLNISSTTNNFINFIKVSLPKKLIVKSHLPNIGYYDIAVSSTNTITSINKSNKFYNNYNNLNLDGLVINENVSIEGNFFVKGDITAFAINIPSDIRLKKNVSNITNGLDIINKLRPVSFKWNKTNEEYIGFIAQEVEEILPNLVKDIEIDGVMIKIIKEDKLLPYIVDSIKNISNRLRKYEC
jgi:hypothetical protein